MSEFSINVHFHVYRCFKEMLLFENNVVSVGSHNVPSSRSMASFLYAKEGVSTQYLGFEINTRIHSHTILKHSFDKDSFTPVADDALLRLR